MSLKILSWNVEGRLSPFAERGRGTPEHILSEIRRHNADVIVLSEASEGDDLSTETTNAIEEMGYDVHTVYYDDKGSRLHAAEAHPTLKLLSRKSVTNVTRPRYGDIRNALTADIMDDEDGVTYLFFGIHLDDRSEANRLLQTEDLVKYIDKSPLPIVMMGDFNAMHGQDIRARLLRSDPIRFIGKRVPHRLASDMLQRVSDMATGKTLQAIETHSSLRDVDSRHRPTSTPKLRGQTWLPSVRLIQIDHIYVSPDTRVYDFGIASDGGSDHRAIYATISRSAAKH